MPVSFDKLEKQAPGLVSLAKKAQFNLSKRDLTGHVAKVAICLDYSGSMRPLYKSGQVQALAERVLALATQLDDDGAVDVFCFDSGAAYLGELTPADYIGGVDRLTAGRRMGTTNYAAAMQLVRKHYATGRRSLLRKERAAAEMPAYVIFVTDGAPDSRTAATKQLVESSRTDAIFWQFMGVGNGPFDYLRRLDESVPGRLIDNANFFEASDIASVPDQRLFDQMLAEYPGWLPQARAHGLLV
jgi:uncharacterized protein YegL